MTRRFALLFLLAACGGNGDPNSAGASGSGGSDGTGGSGGTGGDTAGDAGQCAPIAVEGWAPVWKPPHMPRNACTETQLQTEYVNCDNSASHDAGACTAFKRDPANGTCRTCLFSTEDESSYGPIVYLPNNIWRGNIGGCMALVDGDITENGCGSRYQAWIECQNAVCAHCPNFATTVSCRTAASASMCKAYLDSAICRQRPAYDVCTTFANSAEEFASLGTRFCSTNPPDASSNIANQPHP